jgi:hypothetical protein
MQLRDWPQIEACGPTDRRAGSLLFLGVYRSELVGRTGFEPVTSSVSGNSRTVSRVCHRRAKSNGEPLTWAKILTTSRWARRRLVALAPISGSQCPAGMRGDPAGPPPRDEYCVNRGRHAWWRSGAVTVATSKCHDQCRPTAEMASTRRRSWIVVPSCFPAQARRCQAASVVVTVRLWSAKLATSSKCPPSAWT